jgi:broad specificity phosphatase PhoE
MLTFLAEIDSHGTTAVVSHGTALRTVIGLVDGLDPHRIGWTPLANTEVVERELPVGTWERLLRRLQDR